MAKKRPEGIQVFKDNDGFYCVIFDGVLILQQRHPIMLSDIIKHICDVEIEMGYSGALRGHTMEVNGAWYSVKGGDSTMFTLKDVLDTVIFEPEKYPLNDC